MTLRSLLTQAYRVFDRQLFSRLPARWQKATAGSALRVARALFPAHAWPTSTDSMLVRRLPRAIPARLRKLPDWVKADMDNLARSVDPLLSPDRFIAARPDGYMPPIHWKEAGEVYQRLCSQLHGDYDTVFLIPWLKRGGADLGALHHVKACHEVFGLRTLVITTEPYDSPWAARLPTEVQLLEAGHELAKLSPDHAEAEAVLARLLIQLAPRIMHLIGSHTGWRMLVRHGKALRQATRLYVSLYCDERDVHGYREGWAIRYLADVAPHLHAIITDNSVSPYEWARMLGVDGKLFHVAHFPAPLPRQPATASLHKRRLLWASRLDRQKCPDLLARLASALPDYHWDIYGTQVVPGHGGNISALRKARNVSLHGGYDDFARIVRPDHAAFVYTSAWDGLPNVLLEAASEGLPIVAPDVGGIRDLIPLQYLVSPADDVARYAQAIRGLEDASMRQALLKSQQEHLAGFTWRAFIAELRGVPGYVA